jgi:hypothetical protein
MDGDPDPRDPRDQLPKPPIVPQLTPEEGRMLVVTFIGGLGAIVVGAGVVGLAIALAHVMRYWHPPLWVWIPLAFVTAILVGMTGLVLRKRPWLEAENREDQQVALGAGGFYVLLTILLVLMWIGMAAGVR